MNQHATGTDIERLRARARGLFLSRATIDSMLEWATPRQILAIDRLLATELDNRETAKHGRLMRRARFPVIKSLDGYDFTNVKLPEGYDQVRLLDLDFTAKAHDLVFYGGTGRGKTHLAIALGMKAVERDLNARFHQTAELVLQLGKAKRDGTLENMLKDLAKADPTIPGRVRPRALAPRRGASPLPDHRRFVRKKEHHQHPPTSNPANGARSSPTTNPPPLFNRPHRPPRTPHRIHRPQPAHQRSPHVQQPQPITRQHSPRPNPKKRRDQNQNIDLTKYTKHDNRLDTELKAIGKAELLIIDELGYLPIDIEGARLLFQVIADSYETRSVVFTSNLEFSRWGDVFGDGDMAAAVIDRIVHHGRIIRFHGESYRNTHSLMK